MKNSSATNRLEKIALLTSGGDSPGMNAAIRAIVRSAIFNGLKVVGIMNGYSGLLNKDFVELESHSVSKIISRGGTILKSSRCAEFHNKEARQLAVKNLEEHGINGLIVLGGDGTFKGADLLGREFGFRVVGAACTIDNDIYGTDFTIGFDTALNTAVAAIDKIRDTADSHNMLFFVEVMGRHSGFIALHTAIATGAEAVLIPETQTTIEQLCNFLTHGRRKNKTSGIIIVAEGDEEGGATEIAAKVKNLLPDYETRISTLGHIQRGGPPSCNDRVLASIIGFECVNALLQGKSGVMVGQIHQKTVLTPFKDAYSKHDEIDKTWIKIGKVIST